MDPHGIEALTSKDAIADVLLRYCRGIDRLDLELVRSCYHPDATDEHGSFSGSVDEYLAWVARLLAKYDSTAHHLGRPLIEFVSNATAKAESYGMAVHRANGGAPEHNLVTGFRFIDRMERRAGTWRIAARVATTEWVMPVDQWFPINDRLRSGQRDQTDAVYDW